MQEDEIRKAVRERYGQRARQINSCCSGSAPVRLPGHAERLYSQEELSDLPPNVADVAAGCGNPTALAELKLGEVVLDLGSGGGIDCFLAAKKVGPEGMVIGVDMTPEMVYLARDNADKMHATNVEFRLGEMEHLPVETGTIDVVISNCVICLSPTKKAVFWEAFRVLKSGGRLCISDMVRRDGTAIPGEVNLEEWAICVAGAMEKSTYLDEIAKAGFKETAVLREDVSSGPGRENLVSLKVRAVKP